MAELKILMLSHYFERQVVAGCLEHFAGEIATCQIAGR